MYGALPSFNEILKGVEYPVRNRISTADAVANIINQFDKDDEDDSESEILSSNIGNEYEEVNLDEMVEVDISIMPR